MATLRKYIQRIYIFKTWRSSVCYWCWFDFLSLLMELLTKFRTFPERFYTIHRFRDGIASRRFRALLPNKSEVIYGAIPTKLCELEQDTQYLGIASRYCDAWLRKSINLCLCHFHLGQFILHKLQEYGYASLFDGVPEFAMLRTFLKIISRFHRIVSSSNCPWTVTAKTVGRTLHGRMRSTFIA